jgi:hypothetical protein
MLAAGYIWAVRIRALSVFEGVVYHCHAVDLSNPCRLTLEVDAVTRPGDLDAGPLLVTWAEYVRMVGPLAARRCAPRLRQQGRMVKHLGVDHLAFPTWTVSEP